jgi:hypothetical protein
VHYAIVLVVAAAVACHGLATPEENAPSPGSDDSPSATPPSTAPPSAPEEPESAVDPEAENHFTGESAGVTIVVSGLVAPVALAVDRSELYIGTHDGAGTLLAASTQGGAPSTLLRGDRPDEIVVDDAHIFWGNSGIVRQTCLDGSGSKRLGTYGVLAVAQDRDNVYALTSDASIAVTSKSTGASRLLATGLLGTSNDKSVAVDAKRIYFVGGTDSAGAISSMPLGGGDITTIVSGRADLPGEGWPTTIAIDTTTIYWTEGGGGDGSIFAAPLKGGPVRQLAKHLLWPTSLVVDRGTLYWIDTGCARVMKMPATGGVPKVIARSQPWPLTIAVDETSIYWVNQGSTTQGASAGHMLGQIARAAK